MTTRLGVEFTVPVEVREEGAYYVSACPPLNVCSQGATEEAALVNVAEALHLFMESCFERGTLEEVFKDCGFRPDSSDLEPAEGQRMVRVLLPLVAQAG